MRFFIQASRCLFASLIVIVIHVKSESDLMNRMKIVKDRIFKSYDPHIRPTNAATNVTEVLTYFHPRQIIDLNEDEATLTMDSFFTMRWYDPRLRWEREEYNGTLPVTQSMLWLPDISVFNSHSFHVDPTLEKPILLDSSGWTWWVPLVRTRTSCAIDSKTRYPWDEAECVILMGSWAAHGWEVDFKHSDEVYFNDFQDIHPRWELIKEKTRTYHNETYYECCPEPYVTIHTVLTLKRRPVPEIETTRAPCVLVLLLTLSIFWLPPDSSKKIVLGGFLFVVLNILLVYASWDNKGPHLVLLTVPILRTAMFTLVITILFQVIVIQIAFQNTAPSSSLLPFLTAAVKLCQTSKDKPLDQQQLTENSVTVSEYDWLLLAAVVDKALFVVMSLVAVALYYF